jgi:ribosome-binding ATPase YchF (GTP1/OBG family)
VDDSVDPVRDLETIQSELCKKDLEFVAKAITAEDLAVRKAGGKFKLSALFNDTMAKLNKVRDYASNVEIGGVKCIAYP